MKRTRNIYTGHAISGCWWTLKIDCQCSSGEDGYSRIRYKVAVTDGLDEQLGQFDDLLTASLLLVLQRGVRVRGLLHLRAFTFLRNHWLAWKSASRGRKVGISDEDSTASRYGWLWLWWWGWLNGKHSEIIIVIVSWGYTCRLLWDVVGCMNSAMGLAKGLV